MKNLDIYLTRFKSKVKDEYINNTPNGIIDLLISPQFVGEYCPTYSIEELLDRIIDPNNNKIAYSVFEKHFLKSSLRFKVEYKGKDITTQKMVNQSITVLNAISPSVYSKVDLIKKHLYPSQTLIKNSSKLIQLNNGEWFDSSFNGTNPTTNIRPFLQSISEVDKDLQYYYIVLRGYNNELKNAFLK